MTGAPPSAEPLLRVRDLRVSFGARSRSGAGASVVDGVSFDVGRAESLGLVGESGCGKTTIGRAILRLIPVQSGTVTFDGRDVLKASPREMLALRREMQIVFQDPASSLNPRLRVGSLLTEPILVHGLVRRESEARIAAAEMLGRCGLTPAALDRFPHQFSGGQRQRIAIARALMLRPRFLVCDEPTSSLDVSVQAQILNLLGDLRRDLGLSCLFISHDMAVVQHVCERIAVMEAGRIVESGPRERVLATPTHAYTRRLLAAVPRPDPFGVSARAER